MLWLCCGVLCCVVLFCVDVVLRCVVLWGVAIGAGVGFVSC